ncbi:MAG: PIN domain-containing protein [Gammaproteobacteria bacterium]
MPGYWRCKIRLEDEADNRILECAIAGRAEAIVTGDHAMLRLGKYENVSILKMGISYAFTDVLPAKAGIQNELLCRTGPRLSPG